MFLRALALLLFIPCFVVQAKDLSPDDAARLEQRFVRAQKATQTLQADFEQVIRMPGMRAPVVSKGEFFYSAPNFLRVTYTQPAGDYLLLHDETLEVSRRGKSTTKKPSTDRAARALVALRNVLRGTPEDTEEKMDHKIRREGDEYIVTLTPVVPSPQLPEKIENRVDANSLILRNMTISLPRGVHLEYKFSKPRKDAPLDASLFELKS